jgi:hypothetical protein
VAHGVEEDIVGEKVQILLNIASGVSATGSGERCTEYALNDGVADFDRSLRQLTDGCRDSLMKLVVRAYTGV